MFPIHFTNGEDDDGNNIKYDTLVSFILLASQRAYEEAKLITRLKSDQKEKNSITRLTSINEGDTLIGRTYDKNGNNVDINIIIKEHCHYLSDKVKDIFIGQIEHNNVQVYVKLFKNIELKNISIIKSSKRSSIFLPIDDRIKKLNEIIKNYIEISIAGEILRVSEFKEDKFELLKQLLLELNNIHSQNVIHNDIKPSNIIIMNNLNGKKVVNFIDFEMAIRFLKEDGDLSFDIEEDKIESIAGTQHYNAPEKNEKNDYSYIHPKTDIYSLGHVFMEIIKEKLIENDKFNEILNQNDFKNECIKIHSNLYSMIEKMLNPIRKERPTCLECLQMFNLNSNDYIRNDFSHLYLPNLDNNNITTQPCNNTTANNFNNLITTIDHIVEDDQRSVLLTNNSIMENKKKRNILSTKCNCKEKQQESEVISSCSTCIEIALSKEDRKKKKL